MKIEGECFFPKTEEEVIIYMKGFKEGERYWKKIARNLLIIAICNFIIWVATLIIYI